jgi:hypothetical protein
MASTISAGTTSGTALNFTGDTSGVLQVQGVTIGNSGIGAGNSTTIKNRIINGAMVIDQRNASASVTPTATSYTIDRWQATISQSSKLSFQQNAGSITSPIGFVNYLGITSLSSYSVNSSDYFAIRQKIEGYNVADLGWGTVNAKTITLSFQVYSSLTGIFGGALLNSSQARSYPFSYTISSANTWTQISVTIPGDTTGTWLTTNGIGIDIFFGLGMGSSNASSAGSWQSGTYYSATGATSVVGTNGATFYITGVQLEVGSQATGFEYRQYGTELSLCQRYGYKLTSYPLGNIGYSNICFGSVSPKVSFRTTPTLDSGATFSVSGGSSGTAGLSPYSTSTTEQVYFYNSANNWSSGYQVAITGFLNAEL